MNNVWRLTGLESNSITQNKLIFMIDKLTEYFNYKNIIIGYDNRYKSEKIARTVTRGLSNKLNVKMTDKSVTSPMLSLLVRDNLFDLSVYITGDYAKWETYGFKIKVDKGRCLSFKDSKKIKEIMDKFQLKFNEYKIDWCDDIVTTNFDSYYLENLKRNIISIKNLDQNITFNALCYTRSDILMLALLSFNCKVSTFNSSSIQNISPNPFDPRNSEDSYEFMNISNNDIAISTTDGENLCIQTPKRIFNNEDLALMLAEINFKQNKLKTIVSPDDYHFLKKFVRVNRIRRLSFEQTQYIFSLQNTLIVSTTNCLIDTNYSPSMDANYLVLKIFEHLKVNNLTIDEFYENLMKKYNVQEMSETIDINEKDISINEAFENLEKFFGNKIKKSSKNKIIVETKNLEAIIAKKNQSLIIDVIYSNQNDVDALLKDIYAFYINSKLTEVI